MAIQSVEELEVVLRSLLSHAGWREVFVPNVDRKATQAAEQLLLEEHERAPDFKGWSTDKIRGFALGARWAREAMSLTLQQIVSQRANSQQMPEDEPKGHPYGRAEGADMEAK